MLYYVLFWLQSYIINTKKRIALTKINATMRLYAMFFLKFALKDNNEAIYICFQE